MAQANAVNTRMRLFTTAATVPWSSQEKTSTSGDEVSYDSLLMKKPLLLTLIAVLTSLLAFATDVLAQGDVRQFELGGQFSLLSRNRPTSQIDPFAEFLDDDDFFRWRVSKFGFGGRLTYNLTNKIAFEVEGNFFPKRKEAIGVPDGHIFQCQFGGKFGKRFKKVGFFGKVRPGFVTFSETSQFAGFQLVFERDPSHGMDAFFNEDLFRLARATYFSTDIGGVVEFYPSERIVTRFDIGDTIIRYGEYREHAAIVCPLCCPCPPQTFIRPPETRHNLQFSAGVGVRF